MAELRKDEISAHVGALFSHMEQLKKESSIEETSREELLGLAYKKGDEVYDPVTGKRGKIIAGTRAFVSIQVPRTGG